jgi:phage terminase large subunit-like protein
LPIRKVMKILALCGRGFGKTRLGSENTIERAQVEPIQIALVARTLKDGERIMINSPKSGLLVRSPPWFPATWFSTKHELHWPNGSKALLFSSEEPESLRGNEFHFAWCDELCAWVHMKETWSQVIMCLRLGDNPQVLATTTPKPQRLIRELFDDPMVAKIQGTTFDNADNLPRSQLKELVREFGGTRRGRQELYAEILDELEGALWKMCRAKLAGNIPDLSDTPGIEDLRVSPADANERNALLARMVRIVIGIDPAITTNPWSDITGIVVVGLADDGHLYVLDDVSLRGKPNEWAKAVFDAVKRWRVHRIVVETNRGGQLVESNLRNYATIQNLELAAKDQLTEASRLVMPDILDLNSQEGKVGRAEPISTLYEQGRVHHVGTLGWLEDEMCNWKPFPDADEAAEEASEDLAIRKKQPSPNRIDALVFACAELKPNMSDWDSSFSVTVPPAASKAAPNTKFADKARQARKGGGLSSKWRR